MHSPEVATQYERFFRIVWDLVADTSERRILWHAEQRKLKAARQGDELHDVYSVVHANGSQRTMGMAVSLGLRGPPLTLALRLITEGDEWFFIEAEDGFREVMARLSNEVKHHALPHCECGVCESAFATRWE